MKVGINSRMVKELSSYGQLRTYEVELVELSLAELDFVVLKDWLVSTATLLREDFDIDFTLHAPYQNSVVDYLRINFAERREKNMKVFNKVLYIAEKIGASTIVVHPGDRVNDTSFENVVRNLKVVCRVAEEIGVRIAVENVYTSEDWKIRIGESSYELRLLVDEAAMDNIGVCLDIGHAYISAQMHNFALEEFFEVLGDSVIHLHLHNNYGLTSQPWDKHLPLTEGRIDFHRIYRFLRADSAVLEIKNGSRDEIIHSLAFLKGEKLEVVA